MKFDVEQALGGSSKSGAFGFDVDEALGKKKKRERTWGEAATDTAVQLAEGVNTIAGAVPNLVAPESDTAEFFNRNADFWREQQSEPIKERIAQADQAIDKAGEDGVISQISEAAGQYFSDPVLAARFVTTNLPSMIPGLAATKLAHAAALARGASAARAAAIATTAGGATNAVLNAGGARGEAFEDIKRTLEAKGYSPEQAEQMALSDSRVSAAVGAVAGFISGKTGLEGSIVGKVGAGGALKAGGRAAIAELAGEQIEEVTPKLTTNALASEYDDRSIGKDVGRTIVETAIGSGPGSIVAGGASALEVRRNAQQASPGVPSITNPSGPTAEGEEIRIEPSRQPGEKPLTQGSQMRPEARLAELEMIQLSRPLDEVEVQESLRLLQAIQNPDADEQGAAPAAVDPLAQQAPVQQAMEQLAQQDQEAAQTAPAEPGAAPATAGRANDLESAPAGEVQPPANFWSFAKTRGYKPGQIKVGTPEHTALKAEYDALRAGRQATPVQAPATAPVQAPVQSQVNPASILPINTPNRNATQAPETFQAEAQGTQAAAPATLSPTAAPPQLPEGIDPALQNRDRSRAASVAQMADIARNPDYMRLATSRTPDAGAPMVFAVGDDITSIPEGNEGRTDVAVMADGQRVPFRYAVVDARTVEPSNFADGRVNEAFASNYPGTIKALNNGRTAGVRAAYEQGTAGNYQAELIADAAAHGVPVEAIQRTPNPILVRVYSERSNTPDMAAKSQGQGLGMSPAELARQDAPLFDAAVLTAYQPGDVTSAANRDFVRAFVGKLSQAGQDVAGMMTAEGSLSPAGRQRIQAGLMQAAYGDADLVAELFDSLDTEIKAIGEALKAVAGEWANMRDSARQGLINPEADITDNLLQAVNLVRKARRENTSLLDLVNQPDLMTGETPDELTVGAVRFFYPSPYMTRAAGREAIVTVLRDYTRNAMGTTAGADMFGQVVTPSDILNGITEQGATNAQDPAQEGSRGTDGRRTDGRGPEAPGQGDQQSGADRPGRGTGADRAGERENTAGPAGAGNAQAQEGNEAGRLTERINVQRLTALRREALPIVRTEAYTKKGITFLQDGERTTVLFKGEPIATLEGKRTRDNIVKAIEGTLAQPADILTAYTPQEVIERQDAAETAQRQRETDDRTAAEQDRQRQERDEIRRRSEAAADTFELGQDPMANLTGQRDVFADADQDAPTPTTSRSRQATADERIQDVGEQLYANRRNFTGRGLKWEDVEGLNDTLKIKEVTKAKVWPRPNYEQLVADGMPPVLARMVKHVYDGLSAGPTIKSGTPPTDAELKRYIDTLAKVREGLFGFINDRQLVADFAKGVLTMVRGEPTALGPVSILDMAKQDMDAREISLVLVRRVWPDQFAANVPSMGRFTRGSEAQKDASIIGGNKALGAMQFARDDLRKWIADLGKNWPAKREAWQVQGYRVLAPGEYTSAGQEQPDGTIRMIIRPKEGRGSWRTVFTDAQMTNPPFLLVQDGGFGAEAFTTLEAATEAAREKVKRAPGAGQDLRGTNIEDAERTGPARRQDGEDITPQRLMDAFGFRGVNFGREGWIKQAERQEYLNQAYDGLTDLAEILGVPPKAMSLDGKLGIAFGAQGKGGGFAAHFVPGYNEINLTKTRGAGTLAHEWGHALDHHFATLAGLDKDAEPYMSEHGSKPDTTNRVVFEDGKYVNKKDIPTFGDGIRPEIVQAFRSIYQAMEKRNESPGEMAARRDAAKESALKRLAGWIKAARRAIEESPAENKADLLAEFDQHAEKLREGDTGDGYQKAGKQVFSARVAAVRNLIKDATGRMWSTDETNGLDQNASYVKSLLGKQDADTTHEPQKVATQYKGDSLAMDREKGGKAYWSTPAEMFARAFELYVHDKLSQREQTNTFLTDAQHRASTPVQIADSTSATARGAGSTRDLYLYPVGKEREALREAFDNLVGQLKTKETAKGLMLYEPEGIAYTGDRNERTDRQAAEPAGSARAGTSPTDTVRGERGAVPGRARITGLGISADIQRTGSAALIGRTVSSADELADLAQVYRDPRYETFRVFFTRSNRILHATGVSARLPGQTPMIPAGMSESDYIQAFKDQMADTGADGYYILHNHPSGDPTPSRDDQRVTEYLAAQVPGMKAHVVINSNRYAVIRPGEAVEVKDKDFGDDLLRIPSLPSPILNAAIGKPDDLVTLGKSLQKPGWLTLIGTDSTNKVRLTADVPASALSRDSRVLAGQVRRLMRQSGSRSMYLVGSDADVASQPVRKALSQGILRDAVGTSGRTQAERGLGGQSDGFNQTPGRFLPEPGGDDYQRDSIGSNPPPQPGPDQQNLWTQAKAKVMQLTSPAAIDRLIYEFQDKYIDLKRLRDHIKSIGGTITDLNDAYLGEELYHKRLAKRTEDFLDKELKPLLADMRSRSVALPELERYLHARHAPEANRVLAQRNPNRAMIDAGKAESARAVRDLELKLQRAKANGSATKAIEEALAMAREEAATWNGAQAFRGTEDERLALSGMTDAEAKAFMASLTPRQRQNFQELAERVDAIQSKTLKTLEGYGLMDKATLTAWRDTYQFYVPLHRDEAGPESDRHPIGQGFSVKGTGIKSRVGSNEKVTNILAHIAMQRETALTRGEKNHVVKKLYLMAAQNPDEEFWEIDQPPMTKTIDPRTGFVRTGIDPTYKNKPNVVMVRIAGRDQAIVFNEHNPQAVRLAEAMKNLDVGDLHVVLGLAAKGTRWFASVNTQYNPIFGLINFARDVQAGLLNLSTTELAGKQKEVASHVMTAMRAIYRERRGKGAVNQQWTQLWDEFQDVGGTTGYRDLFADANDRAKALGKQLEALDRGEVSKAAHAVVDWLSDYNETMENAVRLAAYKVALEQGMTKERAASLAKNITVNFNRKGRQAREIGALYAFFNAALQGTARMVETLRGPVGKRIMYGGVMLGVVNTLIGMAIMGADDDDEADNWEQIPEFIKERSIVIPLGREDYATIPMPLGFHVFPNIGRIATEYALGDSEKSLGRQVGKLLLAITDAFNPLGGSQNLGQLVAPTVIDPVVALMQNRDWTGKPIYRENSNGLDPQPGHRMAKDSASTPSRIVAEAINRITGGTEYRPGAWSPTPDQLDYVIGQLTGGLGRELLKVNQSIAAPFTGDELPPYKIPLVGRLYGNTRGPAGQSERFYDNIKLLNEIENEYKGRLRNQEDVEELRNSEPLLPLVPMANQYENQIRKLRNLRRQIVERKEDGYQARAREIDKQIGAAMADLNKAISKARKEAVE